VRAGDRDGRAAPLSSSLLAPHQDLHTVRRFGLLQQGHAPLRDELLRVVDVGAVDARVGGLDQKVASSADADAPDDLRRRHWDDMDQADFVAGAGEVLERPAERLGRALKVGWVRRSPPTRCTPHAGVMRSPTRVRRAGSARWAAREAELAGAAGARQTPRALASLSSTGRMNERPLGGETAMAGAGGGRRVGRETEEWGDGAPSLRSQLSTPSRRSRSLAHPPDLPPRPRRHRVRQHRRLLQVRAVAARVDPFKRGRRRV